MGSTHQGAIVAIDTTSFVLSEIAFPISSSTSDFVFDSTGLLYAVSSEYVHAIDAAGNFSIAATGFSYADGIAIDEDGGRLFVGDSGNDNLWEVDIATGSIAQLGNYDFDSGYFGSALIYGRNGVLLLATGESTQSLVALIP